MDVSDEETGLRVEEILPFFLQLFCVLIRSSLKSDRSIPRTYFSSLSMRVLVFSLLEDSLFEDFALQTRLMTNSVRAIKQPSISVEKKMSL